MSMATEPRLYDCAYCNNQRTPETSVHGSYCSEECYFKSKGEKALNHIKHDHTTCSSCGRIRATVEPPKPDEAFAIDNAYGAVYNSDGDTVSFEAFGQGESAKSAIGFRYSTPAEKEGSCVCGTLERSGQGHFDILHNVETFETLLRIHQRIKDAAINGQREDWPSKAALFRYYEQTEDLAYAVGRAL